MGNYANVFKLDEKANLSDTPRFLDIRISRTTRQSLVIAPESLTSLFNTIREIGMENLLDGIQFESLTTLAVESFFKGMRSDHDMPRRTSICIQKSPVCKRQHAEDIPEDLLLHHRAQFQYCPEKINNSEPPNIGLRKNEADGSKRRKRSRAEGKQRS